MKKVQCLSVLTSLIVFLVSCKKDELTADNKVLIGTWTSISTLANCGTIPGQSINPNWKLTLMEKGKYKVYSGCKTIDYGRLFIKNNLVTFESNKMHGEFNGRTILKFDSDSLNIDRNYCQDDYAFRFVKN